MTKTSLLIFNSKYSLFLPSVQNPFILYCLAPSDLDNCTVKNKLQTFTIYSPYFHSASSVWREFWRVGVHSFADICMSLALQTYKLERLPLSRHSNLPLSVSLSFTVSHSFPGLCSLTQAVIKKARDINYKV